MIDKVKFIAGINKRSANKELEYIIKKYINEYESINGKIEINYTKKNNTLIITTPKRRGHDFKLCFNQRKYAPRTSFG